jgi:hypothetical protein
MIASVDFPRLTEQNHRITSPATAEYNCIAWAANDVDHWWEPGVFWPLAAAVGNYGIGTLEQAFRSLHFEECDDARLEPGFEKVALYGDSRFYTHAPANCRMASGPASWDGWKISNTKFPTTWQAGPTGKSRRF